MKIYEEISTGMGAQVGGAFPGRRAWWLIRRAEIKDNMERAKFICGTLRLIQMVQNYDVFNIQETKKSKLCILRSP